nr:hypothetical protein [Sphingomonas laterariae]
MLLIALVVSGPACADSWGPPTRTTYLSADQNVRLTVVPRELRSPLAYFDDKVNGREPAGQPAGETRSTAEGTLERRVDGRWLQVWKAPLANEVAPVTALVSNDGEHVVTFDDWHMVGLGSNVVAIYGRDGALVRSLELGDILPKDYIEALPRSVSSLWWHDQDRISGDGKHVLLAVVVPRNDTMSSERLETVDVAVDLDTGAVVPPQGEHWQHALAEARRIRAARLAYEADQKAAFVAPLIAPTSADELSWHNYLREAFLRLDPDWKRRTPSTTVVLAPPAPNYALSEGWVRDDLHRGWEDDVAMFAAPAAPERLVAIVSKVAHSLTPGSLTSTRVYVAAPADRADAVRTALAQSGAEVIWLDTTKPIPQRPERLRGETPLDDFFGDE